MKQQAELTLREKVIEILNNHWKAVVIAIAGVVVVMAGILVADYVNRSKEGDSSRLAEDIQEAYSEWAADTPEDRDDAELMELINTAQADYPRHFAAQRAAFTLGLMAIGNEDWETAYTAFEDVAARWPESYLASVSLFNAGSAREEAGDIDGAVAAWQKVVDDYATTAADAPEARFNIGRAEETRGDIEAALEAYNALGAAFPNSRWTDIAKSRILVLESR